MAGFLSPALLHRNKDGLLPGGAPWRCEASPPQEVGGTEESLYLDRGCEACDWVPSPWGSGSVHSEDALIPFKYTQPRTACKDHLFVAFQLIGGLKFLV